MRRNGNAALKIDTNIQEPNLYAYHDYRSYLKDWAQFQKANAKLSLRRLAVELELSPSYLSMILSGDRNISDAVFERLLPLLQLAPTQESYFRLLVTISDSDIQEERLLALERIQKLAGYKDLNYKEIETYKYLTHWYHVVIREMAALPDFKLDAKWIQSRLKYPVSIPEINKAIEFLLQYKFIEVKPDSSVGLPDKVVSCFSGVHRIALAQFHKQMFGLAAESIENTPREQRSLTFHMVAISNQNFIAVKKILDEALAQIESIGKTEDCPDAVYHVALSTFPVTETKVKKEAVHEDI
jgi:uncharacterized protein (TIGR02147 family)